MKKVLMITYHFPPRPGVACLRLQGLAKYLPEFGWEPIILTPKLPGPANIPVRIVETTSAPDFSFRIKKMLGFNPDLRLDEQKDKPLVIPFGKNSFLPKAMEFVYGIINYPDEHKGWIPLAQAAAVEFLQKERVDALLSSSHPVSAHIIAQQLKKKFHIPWAADLRDLWTQNHYYQYGRLRKLFEKKLEQQTLSQADFLFTVSEPLAERLRDFHKKTTRAVPNGFDPEEIPSAPVALTRDFTISYTGRLYDGKRDPELLFQAIRELIDEGHIPEKGLKVRFWGSKNFWLDREIKQYHLENVVCQYGSIRRDEILTRQRESQILLLLNWDDPREKGVYTGKIFEYLASGRPILALGGPRGSVIQELLHETEAGKTARDLPTIKSILQSCWKEFSQQGRVAYLGRREIILRYSHREMAKNFSQGLNQITLKHDAS